jgi:hypothetical protein
LYDALLVARALDPEGLGVGKKYLVSLRELARLTRGLDHATPLDAVDEQLAVIALEEWLAVSRANRHRLNLDSDVRLRGKVPAPMVVEKAR